jgi:ABC-type branched-subunit amino acid transport system ATPase component
MAALGLFHAHRDATGSVADIRNNKRVQQAYLGTEDS